jgi:hypothetical protein
LLSVTAIKPEIKPATEKATGRRVPHPGFSKAKNVATPNTNIQHPEPAREAVARPAGATTAIVAMAK